MEDQSVLKVAGIDLGTSPDNKSTGVQLARKSVTTGVWTVARTIDHRLRKSTEPDPNALIVDIIRECSVAVINAPLFLRPLKPWEKTLVELPGLTASMKPVYTRAILGHAWRARALCNRLAVETKDRASVYEIFPASWFWLCDFDTTVSWKGNKQATMPKVAWFRKRCEAVESVMGLKIEYNDQSATADDADALPCVLCAILLAERQPLLCLDDTNPPVLFPSRLFWDENKLPEPLKSLNWTEYLT